MLVPLGVLVVAVVLLALLARKVAVHATQPFDKRIRDTMQAHRTRALDLAAKPITLVSLPLLIAAATAAIVWWLYHIGRNNAALAIGVTPIVAAAVGQAFTTFFPQPTPPDATEKPNGKPPAATFPSGHTTGVTAEGLAIAYVLSAERLVSPAVVAALLAWPLLVGVSRLYRNRHWFSDIITGWIAGVGVASLSALLYHAHFL
jgi:membrane-associated phospholipid phosphatase